MTKNQQSKLLYLIYSYSNYVGYNEATLACNDYVNPEYLKKEEAAREVMESFIKDMVSEDEINH